MEEYQDIETTEELEILEQEFYEESTQSSIYEESGLYYFEVDALNALVVQNYIIISLLLVIILLKRKWVEIK